MQAENPWADYIGRTQQSQIEISSDRMQGLAALLDYPELPWPAGEAPPTGHWGAIFPFTRQSKLGHDGHEQRGEFYPPITYPRRMWVGGSIRIQQSLPVGVPLIQRSTIRAIENKVGKTGPMCFLTISHEYLNNGEVLLEDVQKIVYREASGEPARTPVIRPAATTGVSQAFDWSQTVMPDAALLFRYSAVSFNGHRIHYDLDYVREEGYPGLLVHAPLTATMLVDLYQRNCPGKRIVQLDYTARSPMYGGLPFTLYGKQQDNGRVSLWAEDCEGTVSMTAELHTI